jgi:hypothetical protein
MLHAFDANQARWNYMNRSASERHRFGPGEYASLTPSAIQARWQVPTEFPACPEIVTENALKAYAKSLKFGGVFARNEYCKSLVVLSGLTDNSLVVLTHLPGNPAKSWAVARISVAGDYFSHRSEFTFLELQGALMQYCELTGESYEDPVDNYC